MSRKFDVVAIGNALVDVLAHVDDAFLDQHGIKRGIMQLVDLGRARELYAIMDDASEKCGGSAANTAVGMALLGSRAAFIGKIRDDALGQVFVDDLTRLATDYHTARLPAHSNLETGRSMILVSPDGERSMSTYLGATEFLTPEDVDPEMVGNTNWLFLEGYRLDGPDSEEAYRSAVKTCKRAGGKVAITLSDPLCIERHRETFRDLIDRGTDLVIGNRDEFKSLYMVATLDQVLDLAVRENAMMVCTLSDKGVVVCNQGTVQRINAASTRAVDTTGAGDQFAAGYLHGMNSGIGIVGAAELGCKMAEMTISQLGARPDHDEVRRHIASLAI